MIVVGDIGGTKCQLAWAENAKAKLRDVHALASNDFPDFASALAAYRKTFDLPNPSHIALGVAGPVLANRCTATNLPWTLDGSQIEEQLGVERVLLANDLVALGYGLDRVPEEHAVVLHKGIPREGNRCLIAAGTGLGESILYWDGKKHLPFGTEGGHTDFGPTNEIEIGLLRYLLKKHDRISWERVVSGKMGFANIYRFLSTQENIKPTDLIPEQTPDESYGPLVSQAAETGCPLAIQTMSLFVKLYGTETGNLALKALATNGIYIAGGVSKHLRDWLVRDGLFRKGLTTKGRFSPLVSDMPVTLVTDPILGLRGCQELLVHELL